MKYTDRQASAMEKAKWKCTDEERAILEGVYRLNPAPDTPTKRKLAVQMRVAPRKIQGCATFSVLCPHLRLRL